MTLSPVLLREAVAHFWRTRSAQAKQQGTRSGRQDAGARRAVTGGAQMDGFVSLVADVLKASGVPQDAIHTKRKVELPGWFRPEKSWDLVVVLDDRLVAAIEFKSHVGPSFGNNFNNRTEEALGNATDLWASSREGAFAPSARPWLGFLMLLEDAPGSARSVAPAEPHFPVFHEFRGASYARRYELLLTKLLRDRLYDGACLILSPQRPRGAGDYTEPSSELSFAGMCESLVGRAIAAIHRRP